MINPNDIDAIKRSLVSMGTLKNRQENSEYMNASVNMSQIFLSLISERSNSRAYKDALLSIKSMGRNAKSIKNEMKV